MATQRFRVNNGLLTDGDVSFEGSTEDGFETALTATDPTADQTISLPNASGGIAVFNTAPTSAITDGTTGQFLKTDGAGNLSFDSVPAGYTNTDVDTHINTSTATSGQYLGWNGTDYAWSTVSGYTDADVDTHINTSTAASGEYLEWNGSDYVWSTAGDMSWRSTWPDDPASGNYPIGNNAIGSLSTGNHNIGIGHFAGYAITSGSNNVAVGTFSGYGGTGNNNVNVGYMAGNYNTNSKDHQVNIGYSAGDDQYADETTAIGAFAMSDGNHYQSTAVGYNALGNSSTGNPYYNVAVGHNAQDYNYYGDFNISVGWGCDVNYNNLNYTTSVGADVFSPGSYTTCIGYQTARSSNGYSDYVTLVGSRAGYDLDGADYCTFVGFDAGYGGGTGTYNQGVGYRALYSLSSGSTNTGVGTDAGLALTTGSGNVMVGQGTGDNLTTGSYNIFMGYAARPLANNNNYGVALGYFAKAGNYSVAIGENAGGSSISGSDYNVMIGRRAGYDIAGGDNSVFIGYESGYSAATGNANAGVGRDTLKSLTSGFYNNAIGYGAGRYITSGAFNTALGGYTIRNVTTGDDNTGVGYIAGNSLTTGSNNTIIGHDSDVSSATVSNEITLGDSNIATLRCNVQTISSLSDERDKTAIEDLPYGLDFINDMRPVQFTWNRRDGSLGDTPDMGFIAQDLYDVELTHSSTSRTRLVKWENPEKLEADYVRSYPILVKAVQQLSAKCDALEARIAELEGE